MARRKSAAPKFKRTEHGYSYGPLGLTKSGSYWVLVHLPTNHTMAAARTRFRTLKAGKAACVDILPLTDWTHDDPSVYANETLFKTVRAVAVSHGGIR